MIDTKFAEGDAYEDFDCTIGAEADEGGFTLLPEGTYSFRVTKLVREKYSGSDSGKIPPCWKAVLSIEIDGEEAGKTITTENLFLTRKYAWKIKQLFVSVGQIDQGVKEFSPNWNALIGQGGMLRITQRKYTGRDGSEKTTNSVDRFLTPEETAQVIASAPSQQQQSGFNFPGGAA